MAGTQYPTNGGNRGAYGNTGVVPYTRRGRISKGAEALKGLALRIKGTKGYR